jgi:predicted transcriptional regulator of viral defense system
VTEKKMRISRLKIAKRDIQNHLENLPTSMLTRTQIDRILFENREFWRVSVSTTVQNFIDFLLKETKLKIIKLKFPSRTMDRYIWGSASTFEIVSSLKPDSYFTHYTAVYLHELTEQIPKTIYLNFEQLPKYRVDKELVQQRIDFAFKKPWRVSQNKALYKGHNVCILNGMFTGKLGVVETSSPYGEKISVTNIERTLIDITVRPIYSGGIFEVLKAYKLAKGRVSVNKLAAMLKKLNYLYPYHQAIGFYLEKAGVYGSTQINLIQKIDRKYDFYLTHQMKDISYSKKWRLYFPKGL